MFALPACHVYPESIFLSAAAGSIDAPLASWHVAPPEYIDYAVGAPLNSGVDLELHDCWSLGCMLVWLVTGQLPFECDSHAFEGLEAVEQLDVARRIFQKHQPWVRTCCQLSLI